MTTQSVSTLQKTQDRLRLKTAKCRPDMHEPDEQDIYARVTGTHLDNAFGDNPYHNCLELTVGLGDEQGNDCEWFNLADLIALARADHSDTLRAIESQLVKAQGNGCGNLYGKGGALELVRSLL
jgi:hypothetical protein